MVVVMHHADSDPFLDGDLAAAAVSRAGLAVLQVDLPTLRITAVSASAAALLGAAPTDLVGCPIRDFVADEPTGGVPLLVTGRLDGFEAPRRLRRVDGAVVEVYVWVHVLGEERPARYGAVMLTTGDERSTRCWGQHPRRTKRSLAPSTGNGAWTASAWRWKTCSAIGPSISLGPPCWRRSIRATFLGSSQGSRMY